MVALALSFSNQLAARADLRILVATDSRGRVAEWLKAPDSKSGVVVRLPEVRILSLPPIH